MTVYLRNLSARSVSIQTVVPPANLFTIASSSVVDPYAEFAIIRSSTSGAASVNWSITQNAYDSGTEQGAYVPTGDVLLDPAVWDTANSGWIYNVDDPFGTTFPNLLSLKGGDLSDYYNAGQSYYDTDSSTVLLFFTYPVAVTVSSITFEATTAGEAPGFKYYTSLTADENTDYYTSASPVIAEVYGNRKYFTYVFPSPITIKSFLITGINASGPGRPDILYGVSNNFVPSVSGVATYADGESVVNVNTIFSMIPTGTRDVTMTLSGPVNGSLGVPDNATGTINLPNFSITTDYLSGIYPNFTITKSGEQSASVDWEITTGAISGIVGLYIPGGTQLVAPASFDEANSGTILETDIGSTDTFPNLLLNKVDGLADVYDGGSSWYNMFTSGKLLFFTYNSPVTISSLAINATTELDVPPSFKYYSSLVATADETYFNANPPVKISSQENYYWYYEFPAPITVQSLLITVQGSAVSPTFIYGITDDFTLLTSGTVTIPALSSTQVLNTIYSNLPSDSPVQITLSNPSGPAPVPYIDATSPISITVTGGAD